MEQGDRDRDRDSSATMSVLSLIEQLDAAHVNAEREAREAAQRAMDEIERLKQEEAAVRIRAEEEAKRKLAQEREEEKQRWHVDEEEAAREVKAMKEAMLRRLEKPKPKPVLRVKDIQTIVIDLGSNCVKAGFAGEDAPRVVVSAIAGYVKDIEKMDLEKHAHIDRDFYFGDEVWVYSNVLEIRRVIVGGVIQDYQLFELFMEHVLMKELKIPPEDLKDYPILVTEPPLSPLANREKLCKAMFDTFEIAALYVANTSTLALFGLGLTTGVVVDIGHEVSMCAAVFQGEVIPSTVQRIDVGGRNLDTLLSDRLARKGVQISAARGFEALVLRDIKERCCYVAYDFDAEMRLLKEPSAVKSAWAKGAAKIPIEYNVCDHGNDMLPGFESRTIPDVIKLDEERFEVPEVLFRPRDLLEKDLIHDGIQRMVQHCMQRVPIDLKREMYGAIALSGGTTLLKGLADRLRKDLHALVAHSVEINIVDSDVRHLAVWRGGSTIASTKGFNFHWISRDEYKEYGVELLHSTR